MSFPNTPAPYPYPPSPQRPSQFSTPELAVGGIGIALVIAGLVTLWIGLPLYGIPASIIGLALAFYGFQSSWQVVLPIVLLGSGAVFGSVAYLYSGELFGGPDDQAKATTSKKKPVRPDSNTGPGVGQQPESDESAGNDRSRPKSTSEPIVYNTKPTTNAEYKLVEKQFYLQGLQHYLDTTSDSADRKKEVSDYVHRFLDSYFAAFPDASQRVEIADEGVKVVGKPTLKTHPFLLAVAISAQMRVPGRDPAIEPNMRLQIRTNVRATEMPATISMICVDLLARCGSWNDSLAFNIFKIDEYELFILDWIRSDFRAKQTEHRVAYCMVERFVERVFGTRGPRGGILDPIESCQEIWEDESLPEWFRAMVRALYKQKHAWVARGTGYAHTVTERGWQLFNERQKEAAEFALRAYEINPMFPESCYCLAESSAHGFNDQPPIEWVRRSMQAQIDYRPALDLAVNYSQEKWGGNAEDLMDLGVLCGETKRYDTNAPRFMLTAISTVLTRYQPADAIRIFRNEEYYQAMRDCCQGFIDFAEKNPDHPRHTEDIASEISYYRTIRAMLAYRFNRVDDALEELKELGNELHPAGATFAGLDRSPEYYRALWHVQASDQKDLLIQLGLLDRRFHQMTQQARYDNREKILKVADEGMAAADQQYEKDFWQMTLDNLNDSFNYIGGDWVDIKFKNGLINMRCNNFRAFKIESESSVILDTRKTPHFAARLATGSMFHGPKTIEYELEFPEPDVEGKNSKLRYGVAVFPPSGNGFVACSVYTNRAFDNWYVGTNRPSPFVILEHGGIRFHGKQYGNIAYMHQKPNKTKKVRINLCDTYAQFFVDGILLSEIGCDDMPAGSAIALMNHVDSKQHGVVRYKNVRIRRWETGVRPFTRDPIKNAKTNIEYFRKAATEQNDISWYLFRQALAHYNLEQYQKAANCAQAAIDMGHGSQHLALLLARPLHEEGQHEEALRLYQEKLEWIRSPRTMREGVPHPVTQDPNSIGLAIANWMIATHPDESIRSSEFVIGGTANHPLTWVKDRVEAACHARDGKFQLAAEIMEQCLETVDDSFKEEAEKQLQCYRDEKLYLSELNQEPFILKLPLIIAPDQF